MKTIVKSFLAIVALAAAAQAYAQDSFELDEDALFGSDDVVEVVAESDTSAAVQSLLVSESVRIGGSFSGRLNSSWTWDNPWTGEFDIAVPDSYGLSPSISALLFFDGRPSEDSRFYGSAKTSCPFKDYTDVLSSAQFVPGNSFLGTDDSVRTTEISIAVPDIEVFELFSDFSWNDSLYFRFGKQTVNWGVGYFFSPANILNLEEIDPADPTAQLEGPVALRTLYSIPNTQHNLWAYAVFDQATMNPQDTAVAAKADFVLGSWELGAGAYYKKDSPVRGMLTAVGSIRDISLFGEGTVQLGSERSWVTEVSSTLASSNFVTTINADEYDDDEDEDLFWKGTAGFSYSNSDAKISIMAQYLYDGEGYANVDRKARIDEAIADEADIKALLGENADELFSSFLKGLIYDSGRHYAALTVSKSELFLDDLSLSVFGFANLSDFSGFVKPTLSYRFFTGMSMSASAQFTLGFENGEYVVLNDGQAMSLSLALTLGSGSF